MPEVFEEGDPLLYMKVGMHAQESLEYIIARKKKEIEDAGMAMWGYGGNTCHPITTVRPFAIAAHQEGRVVRLVMKPMNSHHLADQIRADEYSTDNKTWLPVPEQINVMGSRYALCIQDLKETESSLVLDDTRVALGNSKNRIGSAYLRGRVDKACLEVVGTSSQSEPEEIGLVATLVEPYAVLLRNRRNP